jgi:hypothetical protein
VSGHGGNTNLIRFFAQTTLETAKDYIVCAIMTGPALRPSEWLP